MWHFLYKLTQLSYFPPSTESGSTTRSLFKAWIENAWGRNHAEKTKMDVINSGGLFGLMNAPYLSMPSFRLQIWQYIFIANLLDNYKSIYLRRWKVFIAWKNINFFCTLLSRRIECSHQDNFNFVTDMISWGHKLKFLMNLFVTDSSVGYCPLVEQCSTLCLCLWQTDDAILVSLSR